MTANSLVALAEIMPERGGSVDPSRFPNETFDLYSIPAFDTGKPEELRGEQIGSAKQIVQPGDVLLSRIVPHIRRAWVVGAHNGRRLIASGEWIVFRDERVHPPYLRHAVVTDLFHRQFMATVAGVGGSLLRARPSQVAKIKIPLPPLAEQKRIAAVLDKADDLRAKRRRALATLDTLLQSVFLDMFGDPVTNPKGWPRHKGEALFSQTRPGTRCGPFGSALKRDEYVATGIPVWQIDNVSPNRFGESGALYITERKYRDLTSYSVESGDILISRAGTVGRMCVARPNTSPSIIGTNLIRLSLNADIVAPDFYTSLCTYFPRAMRLRAGSDEDGYSFMNTTTLASVNVIVPPIALQRQFAVRLQNIRAEERSIGHSIQTFDALFASLQSAAFAGRLFNDQTRGVESNHFLPSRVAAACEIGAAESANAVAGDGSVRCLS